MIYEKALACGFEIGQTVEISAVSKMMYTEDGQRYIHSESIEPMVAQVTGLRTIQFGEYHPNERGQMTVDGIGEPQEAYLICSRVEYLWEVRTGFRNSPLLVDVAHIVRRTSSYLPMISHRPKFKGESDVETERVQVPDL